MSPDKNVEAVRTKLLERSHVGLAKYGVTTERTDTDLVGWLNHLQEELMDAAVYVERAMIEISSSKNTSTNYIFTSGNANPIPKADPDRRFFIIDLDKDGGAA